MLVDPVKTSRLRRSRGYSFEYSVVNSLKTVVGWDARRLGGSSTGLPDVVATCNNDGILLVMECKSKDSNLIYIPDDQVDRLMTTASLFGFYGRRWLVFAFKFKANGLDPFRKKVQYRYIAIPATKYQSIQGVGYDLKKDRCVFRYEDVNGDPDRTTMVGAVNLAALLSIVSGIV